MGQLPALMTKTLMQKPVALPAGLPSDRTLALITFQEGQRAQAESWIQGQNLRKDPGTLKGRIKVEDRLLQHYTGDA